MAVSYNYSRLAKLVGKVREGDSQAFADIYSATYKKTYYFALMLLKNEESARDAVQDTYLKALSSIDRLRDDKLLIPWLNKITYTTCMDMLASNSKYVQSDDEFFSSIEDDNELSDPLLRTVSNDTQRRLICYIEGLSPRLRAVVLLKYYDNRKVSEIASSLNVNEGTVKSRLNMARRKLKTALAQHNESRFTLAFLPVAKALETSSAGVNLSSDTALSTLADTLARCDMATKIRFVPQIGAAAHSSVGMMATSGVLAATAVTASIAVMVAAPIFISTQVDGTLYETAARFSVTMAANPDLESIYALSPDGKMLEPQSDGDYCYSFTGSGNGTYTVVAKAVNGKEADHTVTVTNVDNERPTVASYSAANGRLTLTLADNLSGVDFGSVYAKLPGGSTLTPIECDEQASTVVFEAPIMDFAVYISDKAGNISRNIVETE